MLGFEPILKAVSHERTVPHSLTSASLKIHPNEVIWKGLHEHVERKLDWASIQQSKYEWWDNQAPWKADFCSDKICCCARWANKCAYGMWWHTVRIFCVQSFRNYESLFAWKTEHFKIYTQEFWPKAVNVFQMLMWDSMFSSWPFDLQMWYSGSNYGDKQRHGAFAKQKRAPAGNSPANIRVITLVLCCRCQPIIQLLDNAMLLSQRGLSEKISAIMWLSTEATCHSRLTNPCWDKLKGMQQYWGEFT